MLGFAHRAASRDAIPRRRAEGSDARGRPARRPARRGHTPRPAAVRAGPSSSFDLDKGDLGVVTFHLADVLDAASLKAGTGISVTINLATSLGSHASATRTWSFPYARLVEQLPIRDGKYAMTAWLA